MGNRKGRGGGKKNKGKSTQQHEQQATLHAGLSHPEQTQHQVPEMLKPIAKNQNSKSQEDSVSKSCDVKQQKQKTSQSYIDASNGHEHQEVSSCGLCATSFLHEDHKPRVLQCGHTFCTSCCKKLHQSISNSIMCPRYCRQTKTSLSLESLPVNYTLLQALGGTARLHVTKPSGSQSLIDKGLVKRPSTQPVPKERSPHSSKCLDAGVTVASHCARCQVWVCKECGRIDHKNGECILTSHEETLSEMKQAKINKVEVTYKNFKDSRNEIKIYSEKLQAYSLTAQITLDCIEKEKIRIAEVLQEGNLAEAKLQAITKYITEAKTVLDALKVFQNVDDLISKTQHWESRSDSTNLVHKVTTLSKEQLWTIMLLHSAPAGSQTQSGVFAYCTVNNKCLYSQLKDDGGRILVHSLKQLTPPSRSRAMPLQNVKFCIVSASALTFLDLSWGGSYRGRVYIRLMGDTVRGQQFLVLCTGEMGPTFCNSHFHRVWWKGLPAEHVWGGDYNNGDGSGGTPLITCTEDDEKSRVGRKLPISAGLVAGCYEKKEASSLFRIYTKGDASVIEEAAFGRVEYGLNVVESAINHDNISDVIISDCGVVIEP